MDVLWFISGAIVGGIIELIVAIVFESTFRNYYRRGRRVWLFFVENLHVSRFGMDSERYRIGNVEVNVIIIEGSPRDPLIPRRIKCHLDEDALVLQSELQLLKKEIELEQELILQEKGSEDFHNEAMTALTNYAYSYTHIWGDPSLYLNFKETDYYTFMATALKLDTISPTSSNPLETLRAKYLSATSFRAPNPNFATSFGINIAIVTDDDYLLIGKRGEKRVSHYHGLYAVPVMETVNPKVDRDSNDQLDVYETVLRGLREELGINWASKEAIKLFTLQVDTRYYLYGLTGYLRAAGYSRDIIEGIRRRGIRDWWESPEHHFIPFRPNNFAQFVKEVGGVSYFHPASFVAICQSLINEFGHREVNKAFKK